MSLEDLRDLYKNSGVPSDVRLRLNGATFRKLRAAQAYKAMGNTVKVRDSDGIQELADINAKYNLDPSYGKEYSLNKNKRWEMVKELKEIMPELAEENKDIRLFEKSNRNEKSSANCTAVTLTKQNKINVKKTYANFESIQSQMNQAQASGVAQDKHYKKEQRKLQLKLDSTLDNKLGSVYDKSVRVKKELRKKDVDEFTDRIVINLDSEDEREQAANSSYAQYEIEYAPKKDVLKYGVDFAKADVVDRVKIKRDIDTKYLESYDDYSEEEMSEEEVEETNNQNASPVQVDLEYLMNIQLMNLIDKKCEAKSSSASKSSVKPSKSHKDNKVYLSKPSESVENYPVLIR